jgi:hypothetical protein
MDVKQILIINSLLTYHNVYYKHLVFSVNFPIHDYLKTWLSLNIALISQIELILTLKFIVKIVESVEDLDSALIILI